MNEATTQFILDHSEDDPIQLMLQASRYPEVDMPFAVRQVASRQRIKTKVPVFYACDAFIYPQQLSIEQSSSELTARHKASLVSGKRLVDLTGGLGVDFYFMAPHFEESIYVERQADLCELARSNFKSLDLKGFTVIHADASTYIRSMPHADVIFIDPHRRDQSGKKTVQISDCEPDITLLSDQLLSKSETIVVKLSPMLDIRKAVNDLPSTIRVDIVAIENECKEIILVLQNKVSDTEQFSIRCYNYLKKGIVQTFLVSGSEATDKVVYTNQPLKYIYEPNAAIMKSGAFFTVAERFTLMKFHPNTHLYTSDTLQEDFPGRIFRTVETFAMSKKTIKLLSDKYKSANISVRNFPLTVDELRHKLRMKDGGDWSILAFTTGINEHLLTVCTRTGSNELY